MKSIRNMTIVLIWIGLALFIFTTDQAAADTLSVDVTVGAYLLNPEGSDGVLLLRFDLPPNLADTQIVFAEINIPLIPIMPDSSVLVLNCNPLLTSWNPEEISWQDLGVIPDKDLVGDEGASFITADPESRLGYFDITGIVKGWANTSLVNNGLILFCDQANPSYYIFEHESGAAFANIKMTYNP